MLHRCSQVRGSPREDREQKQLNQPAKLAGGVETKLYLIKHSASSESTLHFRMKGKQLAMKLIARTNKALFGFPHAAEEATLCSLKIQGEMVHFRYKSKRAANNKQPPPISGQTTSKMNKDIVSAQQQ